MLMYGMKYYLYKFDEELLASINYDLFKEWSLSTSILSEDVSLEFDDGL